MAAADTPINTLMVEGTPEDQITEMAGYIDGKKGAQGLSADVQKLLEEGKSDEALGKIVDASAVLTSAPEQQYVPAYNLLVHLVRNSAELDTYLPKLLSNLATTPAQSPVNGAALNISVLSTIFNVLPSDSKHRYPVFRLTLKLVGSHGLYENLPSQLKNLDRWLAEWGSSEEEIRQLYVEIADIAEEADDKETVYRYLLKAVQTFPASAAAAAHDLAVRLTKAAINFPNRLSFDELVTLDVVQALRESDPELFQLLELFAGGELEDYVDFNDEHEGWLEDNGIEPSTAHRKIRLLTLTSLAASAPDRSLPYNIISRRLQIPSEEVELWVIDVIRAGLVEGKLSQLNQTFLIHRAEYRQFGEKEWKEVGARLEVWKDSLQGVLAVVKAAKESVEQQAQESRQQVNRSMQRLENRGGRPLEVDA